MIAALPERSPVITARAEYFCVDSGYDDTKIMTDATELDISPIIDIRNLWKGGEKMTMVPGSINFAYDYAGNVTCYCPVTRKDHRMSYSGYN